MSATTDPSAGQPAFADALLNPSAPPPADLARVQGRVPEKRFAVYRNNVVASLIEAVQGAFPVVRKLVGDEFFFAAAAVFVRENPPRSPVMIEYGAAFPAWIRAFPPAASVPYLGDVAAIEWAMREAYHAADAPPARYDGDVETARQAVEAGRVLPHPAARVVVSAHPIFRIWAETRSGAPLAPDACPEGWDRTVLIVRPDAIVEAHPAPLGADRLLTAIASGTRPDDDGDLTADHAADRNAAIRLFYSAGAVCA